MTDINTLEGHLAHLVGPERLSAIMASAMAVLGIVIVATGCFSLLLSMVRESAREVAIRLAIGATPGAITSKVVQRSALLAVVGALVGSIEALAVGRAVADQLFEVSPTDSLVFSCSVAGIIGVALLGSYWPARYAGKTDPAATLKYD